MRGTHEHADTIELRTWIIPAYAGNTHQNGVRVRTCGDHPRVCGEHLQGHGSILALGGSSPRMRGTLVHIGKLHGLLGIIPAYAGNTERTDVWDRC